MDCARPERKAPLQAGCAAVDGAPLKPMPFASPIASIDPASPPPEARPQVRLFGQFLVHEGLITPLHLDEALSLMAATNTTLGELAVSRGIVTRAEADEVHRLQQHVDRRWGELALTLQLGGLTQERLEELCWEQQTSNLRLTDALVELGCLSASEIEAQLRRFEEEQDAIDPVAALPRRYREYPPVPALLVALPKLAGRLLRSPLRMSAPSRFAARRALSHSATACLHGAFELAVGLSIDAALGMTFAERMRMDDGDHDPTPFVARFVTRLCEIVVHRLAAEAHALRVDVPDLGMLPRRGIALDLALGDGAALLVLARGR
jgi:hypothetical protein